VSIPTGNALATAVLRAIAAGLSLMAGVLIGWGPADWQRQPSLNYVRQNPMPWWSWGVLFILAAVLILPPLRTPSWHWLRMAGWGLGFTLYGYFAFSTDYAWARLHISINPVLISAVNGWAAVWIVAAVVAARAAAHARHQALSRGREWT